jgi:peptidoglycan/xylan/chitin deacetylase (PgdA/CDA1 family)
VLESWLEDYRYMQEVCEAGVMTYTLHPFVIGRGHRMRMLDTLLTGLASEGARFVTGEQAIEVLTNR